MRRIGLGAAALIFAAGVLVGAWRLHRTTTKTVIEVRTVVAQPTNHTMHVRITDSNSSDSSGNQVSDCSQDVHLPSIGNLMVRAPGNGLTSGDLLGIPDQQSLTYDFNTVYGCQMQVNVPDLVDANFYVVSDGNIQWTLSKGELRRHGWRANLNATKSD